MYDIGVRQVVEVVMKVEVLITEPEQSLAVLHGSITVTVEITVTGTVLTGTPWTALAALVAEEVMTLRPVVFVAGTALSALVDGEVALLVVAFMAPPLVILGTEDVELSQCEPLELATLVLVITLWPGGVCTSVVELDL